MYDCVLYCAFKSPAAFIFGGGSFSNLLILFYRSVLFFGTELEQKRAMTSRCNSENFYGHQIITFLFQKLLLGIWYAPKNKNVIFWKFQSCVGILKGVYRNLILPCVRYILAIIKGRLSWCNLSLVENTRVCVGEMCQPFFWVIFIICEGQGPRLILDIQYLDQKMSLAASWST